LVLRYNMNSYYFDISTTHSLHFSHVHFVVFP
jgi:hypothetical protein